MRKRILLLLAALLALLVGTGRAEVTSIGQLNAPGMRVGVSTGSASVLIAENELPNAEIAYYEDNASAYEAVAQGKLDAFVYDRRQMEMAIASGRKGVHLLDEDMSETVQIAVGISPACKIPDFEAKLNRFIAEMKADGILDDMYDRWVVRHDEAMPDIDAPENPQYRLTVGTSGIVPPYSYYVGADLSGYDIELANRFAAWLGASLTLKVYDYGAIIPACATGDVDCVMANLNITPERAEALTFSDALYVEKIGVMVRGDAPEKAAAATGAGEYASPEELRGKRVGVQTGTISGEAAQAGIGDVELSYYNSQTDCMAALRAGKVDAWCIDEPVARYLLIENTDLVMLGDSLDHTSLAAVFAKTDAGQALRDQYSAFVDGLWADGTMAQIDGVWFGTDEDRRTVLDYENLPDTNGTLRMALDTSVVPFAMVKDNRVVGYDVDIAARFCEANGYRLEVVPMSFDGVLPAVQSGKCDFAACCITVTEERAQSVLFSSENYKSGNALVVRRKGGAPAQAGAYATLDELNGKRVGVQTGTVYDEIVLARLPDAKISYFNTYPDLAAALEASQIDGFPGDEPVLRLMAAEDDQLAVMDDYMESFDFGFVIAKTPEGDALTEEANAWLAQVRESGELDALLTKWIDGPESEKIMPDYAAYPATKGTLRFATEGAYAPMNYFRGDELIGFEVELAARFCEANGYGFSPEAMNFDGILPAVQSGKVDFGAACITITEERRESVNFSDSYYTCRTAMTVLKAQETAAAAGSVEAEEDSSFWGGIKSSFHKTFIREGRWKLFVDGVITTLLITLLAILFGTLLGFGVFMLCRNGDPVANLVTRFCLWLVQGMPMVVLLMILYYIIFGSVAISGVVVAVIGFTLTFGAAVFGLLKMGVGAVDNGQYEAAYALGYSNRRTFFKIILPQALPHVLPSYKGEIVGLIKATSIVGYIAVQDLTKMGDIVRSRTYEAFFPLIAITVIYFVLEGLIGFLVSRISVNVNPKRRKAVDILKGVKTDD